MDIKDAVGLIRERKLKLAIESMEHPAKTYELYRERVGHYNGLEDALKLLLDAEKLSDKDHDDD